MKSIPLLALFFALHFQLTAQIRINEVCAANGDLKFDPDFYDFPSYVELYNAGNATVNVSGYYLSDDSSQKGKWRIPSNTSISPKGFLLIWCDDRNTGLHTNFNLDPDGEEVILSNSSGTEIDRIGFPEQYLNVSFGRLINGENSLGYMVSPTPGAQNDAATGSVRLESPALSLPSGRYPSTQSIAMGPMLQDVEIRYTLDGSEPNASSTLYTGPINITKTTTVKAKTFRAGYLPGKTAVETYFINEHSFTLPVVSVSTRPSYLTDNTIGIIVQGTNGIPGNCNGAPQNWNQDWDRHAVFEYFTRTGEKMLSEHVDIRVQGGCSRNNPQKSLVLRARDKYAKKTFEYEFFNSKPINNFGALVLRNGGNDFYYAMFRDGLMQSLTIGQMDIDYLAFQPAIVYLNGNYWGIQNIREKIDGDYIEANFGVRKDDVDIMEGFSNALEGNNAKFLVYYDSLRRMSLSTPEAFAFIDRHIDVQEYINYMSAEIYYCNTDWPGNNVKFWRQHSTNGKFRWILWDMDFGMGLYQDASYPTHPTLDFATDPDNTTWPNPEWSTRHIRLLLQIPEFRNRFIQTLTTSLTTTFKPERVVDMINTFQNNIKTEMPYHAQRWNLNLNNWNYEVERMRQFASARNDFMKGHIKSFFGLEDNVRINVTTSPAQAGTVRLNGITNASVSDAFYYRNLPFEAVAQPEPGYKFSHFRIRKREALTIEMIAKGADWRYHDLGFVPSATWSDADYSDATWAQGPAELGYGDGDEQTKVGFGGDSGNKNITTYFRKSFDVADTVGLSALAGSVLFDDGIVLYLNGEEIYRNNMPAGAVDHSTVAARDQSSEKTFYNFVIPKGIVKPGSNVLAAEIHQISVTSSDISFDLALSGVVNGEETEYTSTEVTTRDIANSDVFIEAVFAPATVSSGLVINEFSAENAILQDSHGETDDWIEIFNNGPHPIDIGDHFITDNLSSKLKYRIPKGKNGETIIPPGSYKLLWADDDVEQGPLHLGFKLSAEGEELGLYQKSGSDVMKIDEVVFGMQTPLTSLSRIPNITGDFTVTAKTTPLAENAFELPTPVEEEIASGVSLYPNPSAGTFRIRATFTERMDLEIISVSGQRVMQMENIHSEQEVAMNAEMSGVYIIKLRIGEKIVVKRMVKL